MKKLLTSLGLSILLAADSSSYAATEGQVVLNNYDSNMPVLAVGGGNAATFYWQVLGGSVSGTLFAIVSGNTALNVNEQDAPGFFDAGFGRIPSVLGGANADLQVLAWQGTPSDTFETATIRGNTAVFTQAVGTYTPAGALPPSDSPLPLLMPTQIQLAVVPEPSTIALGVLGGLGLLFRRRK